jgi:basic membrane protein A
MNMKYIRNRFVILSIAIFLLVSASCKRDDPFDLFSPDFEVDVLLPAEGFGDRSFVDIVYKGVEEANLTFNFKVNYIVPASYDKGAEWIKNIPNLKATIGSSALVIIAGNQYTDAVNALNGKFGVHKILLFAGLANKHEGLASVVYRSYASSYIGGYMSAKLVPGCKAVVIAAFDAPFLAEYQAGFKQGVIDAGGSVNPTAYVSTGFEGFAMPEAGYALSNSLLPNNNLIFALATGSNIGIINAARDYKEKRYVVGIDADQSWMGLTVVTGSVVALFEKDIYETIDQFSTGTFASGSFTKTMSDGRTEFLMNKQVMGSTVIPQSLIDIAIQNGKDYSK